MLYEQHKEQFEKIQKIVRKYNLKSGDKIEGPLGSTITINKDGFTIDYPKPPEPATHLQIIKMQIKKYFKDIDDLEDLEFENRLLNARLENSRLRHLKG